MEGTFKSSENEREALVKKLTDTVKPAEHVILIKPAA